MSKQTVTNIRPSHKVVPPSHAAFADTAVGTPIAVEVLYDIVRRPRFADSEGEAYVIDTYIQGLPGMQKDSFGNFWLRIQQADGSNPTTLFSAHTDTVHKAKATGTYALTVDEQILSVKAGGVLGADDGTGIWILLNLIEAKVPGLYIFHREEEIGGNGSTFIAKNFADELETYNRAIAFDRKGTRDIITHQGGERCCSDAFADAFADQLNMTEGFVFTGDDSGSFTDTKNYTLLIPECTNLAVGYYDQHTMFECQDMSFVTRLVNRLIAVDWEALPTERDKTVVEDMWADWNNRWGNYGNYSTTSRKMEKSAEADDLEAMSDLILDYSMEIALAWRDRGFDAHSLEELIIGYMSDEER
ncbi:hypothetical protein NL64_06335 [Pseudomonas fluorescens]|uniref:hypothetical protein n=1 Tax=Pseudomonas fluorescens TaxID=294 RepID=UPI00054C5582|nr:hypothetical protein [Pseudomonas fluorescens]KII34876.1 hypothetical protein NL64_06335 [Pseudomonas fluorescens]